MYASVYTYSMYKLLNHVEYNKRVQPLISIKLWARKEPRSLLAINGILRQYWLEHSKIYLQVLLLLCLEDYGQS